MKFLGNIYRAKLNEKINIAFPRPEVFSESRAKDE
jgi:hypothetical protein